MTLFRRIGRAGQGIAAPWDDGDVERVWQGLRRKRRRRAAAAGAGLLSAVGLVMAAAFVFKPGVALLEGGWKMGLRLGGDVPARTAAERALEDAQATKTARPAEQTPLPTSSPERRLRLTDGSTVVPWGAGAEPGSLAIVEDGPRRVRVVLARGGARFDVVHRQGRVFSIRAGEVTVSVLGTAFSVERVADRVGVVVTRGAVLVDWRVGSRRLGAGEEGWFPPLLVAPPSGAAHATALKNDRRRVRSAAVRSTGAGAPGAVARAIARNEAQRWQDEVAAPAAVAVGDTLPEPRTSEDISVTRESGASGTRSGVEAPPAVDHQEASASTLLADADRARLAGRFEDGASLLRRLVRDYPADQRAPLAAFSLGRLLLGELGRPAEAARAFARARALAPEGPLAEDALAREAEAWERAKHLDRARARAAEYLRVYPTGRRAADVNEVIARAAASASP